MIKITRETELKEGMEIKLHNSIYKINGFGNDMTFNHCIDNNWIEIKCVNGPEMNSVKVIKLYLIENNAEIIEDKDITVVEGTCHISGVFVNKESKKVIVNEEVYNLLKPLEKNREEYTMIRFFKMLFNRMDNVLPGMHSEWLKERNISEEDLISFYRFGWKVEKPKKWYRVFITMAGNAIVAEDEDVQSTPRDAHISNGNYFETHEEAQDIADEINSILRDEE